MTAQIPHTVQEWARTIPRGSSILNLGSDDRVPISQALTDEGFIMHGVDASAVEDSAFFNRTFDAVVAWDLMSLLPPDVQSRVIGKVARALRRGGKFLFTAPKQPAREYQRILRDEGLLLVGQQSDEAGNHCYFAAKP
jgi:SAM-dependent methyltransferase